MPNEPHTTRAARTFRQPPAKPHTSTRADELRRERDTLVRVYARICHALGVDPRSSRSAEEAIDKIRALRAHRFLPLFSQTVPDLTWRPTPGDRAIVGDYVRLWHGQRGTVRATDGPIVALELDTTGLIRLHRHHLRKERVCPDSPSTSPSLSASSRSQRSASPSPSSRSGSSSEASREM